MSGSEAVHLAQDERAELADFLAGLAPAQWDAPTLCHRWRVRDVVAHIISYDGSSGIRVRELRSAAATGCGS